MSIVPSFAQIGATIYRPIGVRVMFGTSIASVCQGRCLSPHSPCAALRLPGRKVNR